MSPVKNGPGRSACLIRLSAGALRTTVMVAVVSSLTTWLPAGSAAYATAMLTTRQLFGSGWSQTRSCGVTVYVPWHVVVAPAARVVASQVMPVTWSSVTVRSFRAVLPVLPVLVTRYE